MTVSPVFGLPYISGQQSQPDVTHNEALLVLQAMYGNVYGLTNDPPVGPTAGEAWIVGQAPTGDWAGRANCIAIYEGGWRFMPGYEDDGTPIPMGAEHEGLRVWRRDLNELWVWHGGDSPAGWVSLPMSMGGDFVSKTDQNPQTILSNLIVDGPANRSIAIQPDSGMSAVLSLTTESSTCSIIATRYQSSTGAFPQNSLRKFYGTVAAPLYNGNNSILGQFQFSAGLDSGGGTTVAYLQAITSEAHASGALGTYLRFFGTAIGSATAAEMARMRHLDGLSMFGANVVIDENRIFRLRVYTVATLPAAGTRGRSACVSAATAPTYLAALVGGGAVSCPVFDNGAAWVSH